MRRLRYLLSALILLPCILITVYSHPGDTDSSGGHRNHASGAYHYHHGYEAHVHNDIDGDGTLDCPIEFYSQADHSSGSNSTQTSSSSRSSKQDTSRSYPTFSHFVIGYIACAVLFTISAIFSDYLYDTNPYGLYSLFEGIPFVLYILSFPLSELFRRLAKSFLTAIKK